MDIRGKNIFITSCGGLGDLIVCTPALKSLKEKYDCHITFLCQKKYESAIKGLEYIDKVVSIERGKFMGRYKCILSGKLWKQDCIVFTDWHPILLLAAHLFRVPLIAGVAREGHRFTKYLTRKICNHVFADTCYAALSNAVTYGEALDIDLDGDMENIEVAAPLRDDCEAVRDKLSAIGCQENRYILLAPFAALKQRNWSISSAKKFAEKAEKKFGLPVIVMGAISDCDDAELISNHVMTGKTTILQMVQLIKKAKVMVSVDSGPMHIAGAVGTPLVALFSKDLPSRWAPRNMCRPIYMEYSCSPCSDSDAAKCKSVKCMRDITEDMVIDSLSEMHSKGIW